MQAMLKSKTVQLKVENSAPKKLLGSFLLRFSLSRTAQKMKNWFLKIWPV
jgi:hypothetical protein